MNELLSIDQLGHQQESHDPLLKKDYDPTFRMGAKGRKVAEVIGEIIPGKVIQYKTKGKWSTHQVLSYLLSITGPAKVYLSTYTASEDPLRQLVKHLQEGQITELFCVFDYRIKTYNGSAFQLIAHNCPNIALVKNHAKVMVVENEKWHLAVITSSNWNNNKRNEVGIIFTDKESAAFHRDWIMEEINGAK